MGILYRLRRLAKPRIPGRLLFTHVPKTGGSSVDMAIRRAYRIPPPAPDYEAVRKACIDLMSDGSFEATEESAMVLCHYAVQKEWPYVSGHFPTRPQTLTLAKDNGYTLATIIRHPVDRFISTYTYHYVRLWELGLETPPPLNKAEDRFRKCSHNDIQTDVRFQGSAYQDLFGGTSAKEILGRINQYDVIGRTSNLKQMENDFRSFGFKVQIGHENKTSKIPKFSKHRKVLRSVLEAPEIQNIVRGHLEVDMCVFRQIDDANPK